MGTTILKTGLAGAAALTLMATTAEAGGFGRGEADTDLLYQEGSGAIHVKGVYVAPRRGYATVDGKTSNDDSHLDNYFVPSIGVMARMSDNLACAGTYTQPFGASSTYGPDAQAADILHSGSGNATLEAGFRTREYGLTCSVGLDLEKGRFSFLGGIFHQSFDYKEVSKYGTLRLADDSEIGYRLGAAYEIPEIALRADILYRSQIDHKGSGSFTISADGAGIFGAPEGYQLAASGWGSLPQSVKVGLQSGIAPGWVAFGAVKWTDWSVLPALNYTIAGLGALEKNFNFRDGWTITGGIGHTFTDTVSGAVSVTWDRGVGTGADILTDTWTLGLGTAIKSGPGEFRIGGAVTYLTSGSQVYGPSLADYDATVGGDFAYGASISYLLKF